jgi:hypothetical protein
MAIIRFLAVPNKLSCADSKAKASTLGLRKLLGVGSREGEGEEQKGNRIVE